MVVALTAPVLASLSLLAAPAAFAQPATAATPSMTATYSQQTLLKNWALSVCLAHVADVAGAIAVRDDANATASAYLEFGRQPLADYEALAALARRYAQRRYSGSIDAQFNTMKCIDLFHSAELERFVRAAVRATPPAK